MLLSMNLLQHLPVGCCWLPTHPSLAVVGVVNSRQLLQLDAGDRLLMVLRLQASLDVGDILRLQQALAMLSMRKDGAQAAADKPSQLKSKLHLEHAAAWRPMPRLTQEQQPRFVMHEGI